MKGRIWAITGLLLFCAALGWGDDYTWVGSTNANWDEPSNWDLNNGNYPSVTGDTAVIDPVSGGYFDPELNISGITIDSLIITTGAKLTLGGTYDLSAGTVDIDGELDLNGNTLTVSGDVTGAGTLTANNGMVSVGGNWNVTSLGNDTLIAVFTGTGTIAINNYTFDTVEINTSGAYSVTGDLKVNNDLSITSGSLTTNGSLEVGNDLTIDNNGTLELTQGANITGNVTGAGTLTLGGDLTVDGDLTFTGTAVLDIGNATVTVTGDVAGTGTIQNGNLNVGTDLTINGSAVLIITNTSVSVTGNVTVDNGTLTITGDLGVGHDLTIASGSLTLGTSSTIGGNVTGTGTGTITGGNLAVGNNLIVNTGAVLDIANTAIAMTGNINIATTGTLKLDGTQNFSGVTITTTKGKVVFTGNNTGLAGLTQFYDLEIESGARNVTSTLTINNDLTINGGVLTLDDDLSVGNDVTIANTGSLSLTSSNQTITIGGSWDMSATTSFAPGTSSTVIFTGNNGTSILTNNAPFYNLTINTSAGYNVTGDLVVDNDLTITTGSLTTSANLTVSGDVTIAGTVNLTGSSQAITVRGSWDVSAANSFIPGTSSTVTFTGNNGTSILTNNAPFYNLTINTSAGYNVTGDLVVNNDLTITTGSLTTTADLAVGGDLTVNGGTLIQSGVTNVSGNLSITAGDLRLGTNSTVGGNVTGAGTLTLGGDLTVGGDWNVQNLTAAGSTVTFNGSGSIRSNSQAFDTVEIDTTTATLEDNLEVNGGLTIKAGAVLDIEGNSVTVVGSFTIGNGGIFRLDGTQDLSATINNTTPSSGTVVFTGTGTGLSRLTRFYNLEIASGASNSTSASVTVANNISIGGTLTLGDDLTVAGNWNMSTATSFYPGTSTVTFDGNGTINSGGKSFNNLVVNTPSRMVTAQDKLLVNGSLTVTAGTLELTQGANITENVTGAGTLTLGGNVMVVGGSWGVYGLNANGSTVTFTGTGTITSNGQTFGTVEIASSGTYTANGGLNVVGTLIINTGAVFDITNTNTTNVGALTINTGGTLRLDGTQDFSSVTTRTNNGKVVFTDDNTNLAGLTPFFDLEIASGNSAVSSILEVTNDLSITGGSLTTNNSLQVNNNLTINNGGSLVTSNALGVSSTVGGNVTGAGTLTLDGNLTVGGSWDMSAANSFIHGTSSTVNFTGAGAINLSNSSSFYNLTIDSSAAYTVTGDLVVNNDLSINGSLTLGTNSTVGGNVTGAGTLTLGGNLEVMGDWDVHQLKANNSTVTFTGTGNREITTHGELFNNLNITASVYTVNGALNVDGTLTLDGDLTVKGSWNVRELVVGSVKVTFDGSSSGQITTYDKSFYDLEIVALAVYTVIGKLNVKHDLTIAIDTELDLAANDVTDGSGNSGVGGTLSIYGTLKLAGNQNFSNNNDAMTNSGTVVFTGNTSTGLSGLTRFHNLEIASGASYLTSVPVTVANNISGAGTLTLGDDLMVGGSWGLTSSLYTGTPGVLFTGTGTSPYEINLAITNVFYNLTISTSAGYNVTGDLVVNNDLSINGSLTLGTNSTVGGNVTGAGTLTLGGNLEVMGDWDVHQLKANNSTVTFTGTGNREITTHGELFNNLNITASVYTVNGALNVDGTLTLDGDLTVEDDWNVKILAANGSKVTFTGSGNRNITTNGQLFNNLEITTSAYTINGALNVDDKLTLGGNLKVKGSWNVQELDVGSVKVTFDGSSSGQITTHDESFYDLEITTSAYTVNGALNVDGTLTLGGNLEVRGDWDVHQLKANSSTVTFTGTSNREITTHGEHFNNLNIITSAYTVNGALNVNSTLTLEGDLTVKDNWDVKILAANGSKVTFSGSGNIKSNSQTFAAVEIVASAVYTLADNLSSTSITIANNGTLNLDGNTLTASGDVAGAGIIMANDGTVYVGGNWDVALLGDTTLNAVFTGSGNITSNGQTFAALEISTSAVYTVTGLLDVVHDLSITEGGLTTTADLTAGDDVTVNGGSLTITGNLAAGNDLAVDNKGTLTINGDLDVRNDLTIGDSNLALAGNLDVTGNLNINTNAIFVITNTSTTTVGFISIGTGGSLKLDGTQNFSGATMVQNLGTVVFTGTGADLSGLALFYDLEIASGASNSTSVPVTVANNISGAGTLTLGDNLTVGGDWKVEHFTANVFTVTFNGSVGGEITNGENFYDLEIAPVLMTAAYVVTGTLNVTRDLIITNGSLTLGAKSTVDRDVTGAGTLTLGGDLTVGGDWDMKNLAAKSFKVTFNGSSGGQIKANGQSFYDLMIATSANYNVTDALNVTRNLTITGTGTLTGSFQTITIGGNWDQSTGGPAGDGIGAFAHENSTVKFTGQKVEIRGNTSWHNFEFIGEPGAVLQFSVNRIHTFSNRFRVHFAIITKIPDEGAGSPLPPGSDPKKWKDSEERFWNLELEPEGKFDLKEVEVYYSHAVQPVPVSPLNKVTVRPYYDSSGNSHYNVNWIDQGMFLYSYTEDSDHNGRIDRIRLQADFYLSDDFTDFEIEVVDRKIDTTKNNGYDKVPSRPDCIYIYLEEQDHSDGGDTLTWRIVKNTSLGGTLATGEKILVGYPGEGGTTTDTVPPRINYTLALPESTTMFIQFSEPVKSPVFSFAGVSLDRSYIESLSSSEYLITLPRSLNVAEIAGGVVNITVSSEDLAQPISDEFYVDPGGNLHILEPAYPADWEYDNYVSVPPNSSARANIPAIPANQLYDPVTLSPGPVSHRVSDILISQPPNAAESNNYFAWPLWAKDNDNPLPNSSFNVSLSDDNGDLAFIRDFTGKSSLQRRDITLQAYLNPDKNLRSASLKLYYANTPPAGYQAGKDHGSEGLWLPPPPPKELRYTNIVPRHLSSNEVSVATGNAQNIFTLKAENFKDWERLDFFFQLNDDLYIARLDQSSPLPWYRNVKPFSILLRDILLQRSGVTILNNVINPDRGEKTHVEYTLSRGGPVTIQVFTLDGNLVKILRRESRSAGEYRDTWDGKNQGGRSVARGMYFVRVVAPDIDEIRKVMVVK